MNEKPGQESIVATVRIAAEAPHLAELISHRQDWELATAVDVLNEADFQLVRRELRRLLDVIEQDKRSAQR